MIVHSFTIPACQNSSCATGDLATYSVTWIFFSMRRCTFRRAMTNNKMYKCLEDQNSIQRLGLNAMSYKEIFIYRHPVREKESSSTIYHPGILIYRHPVFVKESSSPI